MSLEAVEVLLNKRIGVDATIIGPRKIARAVEARRIACELPDLDAYIKLLHSSSQEFDQLVERIVVSETWFFRDRKPFDFLTNYVRSEGLLKAGTSKLRVLSVPCSTGEEPYSIAIALLEAGLPAHRFSVDGIDISHHAIAKAQQAVYGKNSFRGADWVDRNRYFQKREEKYTLSPAVRGLVNFRQGNLLNEFALNHAKYDIIFCRNLLIYLEPQACDQVFTVLDRLLLPKGHLFVGSSETGRVPTDRFTSIRQPSTFAYCKEARVTSGSRLDQPSKPFVKFVSTTNSSTKNFLNLQPRTIATSNKPEKSSQAPVDQSYKQPLGQLSSNRNSPSLAIVSSQNQALKHQRNSSQTPSGASRSTNQELTHTSANLSLKLARQLADAGDLEAAIKQCKQLLDHDFTNAEIHTLLGTLYQANTDDIQAEQCFRKALYLNPNDYNALMHLALLKEHHGDVASAKILQQRIQKLQQPT